MSLFKIDNVCIQSCYAFSDFDGNGKSIGLGMVAADNISKVFGTNAPLAYNFAPQTNQVAPGYNMYSLEYSKDTGFKVTEYGWIKSLLFWEFR